MSNSWLKGYRIPRKKSLLVDDTDDGVVDERPPPSSRAPRKRRPHKREEEYVPQRRPVVVADNDDTVHRQREQLKVAIRDIEKQIDDARRDLEEMLPAMDERTRHMKRFCDELYDTLCTLPREKADEIIFKINAIVRNDLFL